MTRLVRSANGVVVDSTGKQNGRGAYVCDRPVCWDKIVKSKLLDSALKTELSESEKAEIARHRPLSATHPAAGDT